MKLHILAFIANYLLLSEKAANKYTKCIKHKEVLLFLRLQYMVFIVGFAIRDRFSTRFIFLHQELCFSARLLFCPGEEFLHSCLLINFFPLEAIFPVLILPYVAQVSTPTGEALKSLTNWYTKRHCQAVEAPTDNF